LAGLLLVTIGADTHRLLPLFAIGVFIGFTISQVGLVKHWLQSRGRGWFLRALLNGTGALLSALAAVIFFVSKFTEGAWLLLLIIPALIALFGRIERYYRLTGRQLGVGQLPERPERRRPESTHLVLVPVVSVNRLAKFALDNARRMGGEVEAVCVDTDHSVTRWLSQDWERWDPGTPLRILPSRHRALVTPLVDYVRDQMGSGREVIVLLAEVQPRRRRYEILHNQRGMLLAAALRARTDAVVATVAYRLTPAVDSSRQVEAHRENHVTRA
jgi:hypothetical protein